MVIQKKLIPELFILFIIFIIFTGLILFIKNSLAASVNISANVQSLCGNGIINSGESCDGSNLAGQTCVGLGFAGGILTCNSNCTLNTSQCIPPSSGSGGGGGGGGGGGYIPLTASVFFSGRAYPQSKVTLLKDGQIAAQVLADPNANFNISLSGLSGGSYLFGIRSEDKDNIRSSLLTFPITVTPGARIEMGGIFIAPTIAVDKSEVKKGNNIAIFGQSSPNADITIAVHSEEEIFVKTFTDKNGVYLYNFDTSPLAIGEHTSKSKAAYKNLLTPWGQSVSFRVGTKDVSAIPTKCPARADLNNDCRVNLVDFSIAAYWYKRQLNPDFLKKEKQYLNGDGKITLVDFSIMAYYWTG